MANGTTISPASVGIQMPGSQATPDKLPVPTPPAAAPKTQITPESVGIQMKAPTPEPQFSVDPMSGTVIPTGQADAAAELRRGSAEASLDFGKGAAKVPAGGFQMVGDVLQRAGAISPQQQNTFDAWLDQKLAGKNKTMVNAGEAATEAALFFTSVGPLYKLTEGLSGINGILVKRAVDAAVGFGLGATKYREPSTAPNDRDQRWTDAIESAGMSMVGGMGGEAAGHVIASNATRIANFIAINKGLKEARQLSENYRVTSTVMANSVERQANKALNNMQTLKGRERAMGDRLYPQVDVQQTAESLVDLRDEAKSTGKGAVAGKIDEALRILAPPATRVGKAGATAPVTSQGPLRMINGQLTRVPQTTKNQLANLANVPYSKLDEASDHLAEAIRGVKEGPARSTLEDAKKVIDDQMGNLQGTKGAGRLKDAAKDTTNFERQYDAFREKNIADIRASVTGGRTSTETNQRILEVWQSRDVDRIRNLHDAMDLTGRKMLQNMAVWDAFNEAGVGKGLDYRIDPDKFVATLKDNPGSKILFQGHDAQIYEGISRALRGNVGAIERFARSGAGHLAGHPVFMSIEMTGLITAAIKGNIPHALEAIGTMATMSAITKALQSETGRFLLRAGAKVGPNTPEMARYLSKLLRTFGTYSPAMTGTPGVVSGGQATDSPMWHVR